MTAVEVAPDLDSQMESTLPTTSILQAKHHRQLTTSESWLRSRLQIDCTRHRSW